MKILMALTYYAPHWTGLTAYAVRLAEGLAARGHQVTVVTSRYRDDLRSRETRNGVNIVRLASWFRLSRGQVMPAFIPTVMRLAREHDVVQCHTPMLETWLVGALSHMAGRKMLMTHHGDLVMPAGFWNQFVQLTVGYLLDRGAASADVISIHSQDYADNSDYLRPFAEKVVAIYPPAVIPTPNKGAMAEWRQCIGVGPEDKLVGFAGRFVEEKGFDYLLKAIPLVLRKMPGCKFAYAGDHKVVYEDFYGRWEHLVEAHREHIEMVGLITDQQMLANFYGMCDVFCLPSRTDCFPSVQIESLLCGTPLVTADIPGAREVVKVTGMGLLVEPRNERALAEGLVQVLGDPARFAKTPEAIRQVFSLDRSVTEYEHLIERMIADDGR